MKELFLKFAATLGVILLGAFTAESLWGIIIVGRQYETAPVYQLVFYATVPIIAIVATLWAVLAIWKANWKF